MSVEVQELLLQMKDTSELMVDLAYSALFYDSRPLANEVETMEEEMGEHLTNLQRQTLQAVQEGTLSQDHAMVLLRVAQTAEIIANAALEITDVVLRDVELHPVIAQSIRDSESTVTKVQLHPGSPLISRSLSDMELETDSGMRILAVKRAGRWRMGVDGTFVLRSEDLLIAMGPLAAEAAFLQLADPTA